MDVNGLLGIALVSTGCIIWETFLSRSSVSSIVDKSDGRKRRAKVELSGYYFFLFL